MNDDASGPGGESVGQRFGRRHRRHLVNPFRRVQLGDDNG